MFRDKFIATFRRDLQDIAHFFVGCFSSTGDNLDQWRAYADNGRGFALGFDGPRLTTTFDAGGNGRSSFPIVYRQRRVNQPFKQLIDLLVPMIGVPRVMNLEDNDDIDSYMGELSALVTLTLVQLAMLVKHPAYKHEHEHRLLHLFAHGSPIAGVEYRMRRGSLTRSLIGQKLMPPCCNRSWWGLLPRMTLRNVLLAIAAERSCPTLIQSKFKCLSFLIALSVGCIRRTRPAPLQIL